MMNTLIAVGAVNALFLSLLVQAKRRKAVPDYILSLFLLLVSVAFALVYGALEYGPYALLLILTYSNLLFAPIFFLYVATMVDPGYRLARRFMWHFLLLAISSIYLLYLLDTSTDAELTSLFLLQAFAERPMLFNAFYLLDLAAMPLYLVLSWRSLRRHQQRIAESFSYRESIDYRWLRRLTIVMAITWVVIDLPLLGDQFVDRAIERETLPIGFSLTTLLVYYLGFYGFRQGMVYAPAPQPASYRKSGLSGDEVEACKTRLLDHMESERPYLDATLAARDLAGVVGLTEHNLSEVINVELGKNFYDFINGYRVEEFRRRALADENAHLSLLALAMECGFNSKSSFNRVFKQHTGTTPSAYLKSHRHAGTTS